MLQLGQIAAEQIAIGERNSFVGLHIGECRTEGFIGTNKAKHQLIAIHRQRPSFTMPRTTNQKLFFRRGTKLPEVT